MPRTLQKVCGGVGRVCKPILVLSFSSSLTIFWQFPWNTLHYISFKWTLFSALFESVYFIHRPGFLLYEWKSTRKCLTNVLTTWYEMSTEYRWLVTDLEYLSLDNSLQEITVSSNHSSSTTNNYWRVRKFGKLLRQWQFKRWWWYTQKLEFTWPMRVF